MTDKELADERRKARSRLSRTVAKLSVSDVVYGA